ncbi:MAG: hypothetical protein CL678_10065 [Bdellovibrionaceae bacterium]|nr:hypothetical protein [Pseudobdellovibrionaceae bacterium]|tara:strand:+ start:241 stop:1422 length:1182 start_codon:yes stop_codon:yes gene_type:complete
MSIVLKKKNILFLFVLFFNATLGQATKLCNDLFAQSAARFTQPIEKRLSKAQVAEVYSRAEIRFKRSLEHVRSLRLVSSLGREILHELINNSPQAFWSDKQKLDDKKRKRWSDPFIEDLSRRAQFGFYEQWYRAFLNKVEVPSGLKAVMKRNLDLHIQDRKFLLEKSLWMVLLPTKIFYSKSQKQLNIMDHFQDGFYGLELAVDRFNPSKGFTLSTYARNWIKENIKRRHDESFRVIRFPVHIVSQIRKIKKIIQKIEEEGKKTTPQEIARYAKMPVSKVQETLRFLAMTTESLTPQNSEVPGYAQLQRAASVSEDEIIDQIESKENTEYLMDAIENAGLTEIEKTIIYKRFLTDNPPTLKSLGQSFNLSRERIRQFQVRGLQKLKKYLSERM